MRSVKRGVMLAAFFTVARERRASAVEAAAPAVSAARREAPPLVDGVISNGEWTGTPTADGCVEAAIPFRTRRFRAGPDRQWISACSAGSRETDSRGLLPIDLAKANRYGPERA